MTCRRGVTTKNKRTSHTVVRVNIKSCLALKDVLFETRDYQIALLEFAKKQNTVICLPTGSGKTFIALQLIKHVATKLGPKGKDQKKIVFLAVTVPLVQQQSKYIQQNINLDVACYTGDRQVDHWDKVTWQQETGHHEVLAMTPEIFVQMLHHSYIHWKNVALLIVDECHHAVKDHPMRVAMEDRKEACAQGQEVPQVLGLTATLINRNVKVENVANQVRKLEITMGSQAVTYDHTVVEKYATNPSEEFEVFGPDNTLDHDTVSLIEELEQELSETKNVIVWGESTMSKRERIPKVNGILLSPIIHRPLKTLTSFLGALQSIISEMGLYCANIAALLIIVRLEKEIRICTEKKKVFYSLVRTLMHCIHCRLDILLSQCSPVERMSRFVKPKVKHMLGILSRYREAEQTVDTSPWKNHVRGNNTEESDNRLCGLIFVKERITAEVICHFLMDVKEKMPEYSFISPQFVVGNQGNPNENLLSKFNAKRQRAAVDRFRSGESNLIVTTSVLEEGIDIPKCNLVLRFDPPQTFTSYIQSMGRARKRGGCYVLLTSESNEDEIREKLDIFKKIEEILRNALKEGSACRFVTTDEESDHGDAERLLPHFQPSKAEGAPKITQTDAISLVHMYCSMLPQDRFSFLSPLCWYVDRESDNTRFQATLRLPINSPVREDIAGLPMPSVVLAKRSVYLEACKVLYDVGELDEAHLLPVGRKPKEEPDDWVEPPEDLTLPSEPKVGTKKRRQFYKIATPEAYLRSWPIVGKEMYLHVFKMEAVSEWDLRMLTPQMSKNIFGMLCAIKLPKVCKFPLYSKYGMVWVTVEAMSEPYQVLDKKEVTLLGKFHKYLFHTLLGMTHPMLRFDVHDETSEGGLIVPLKGDSKDIDWDIVNNAPKFEETVEHAVTLGNSKEHVPEMIDTALSEDAVVIPWYRGTPLKYYSIVENCSDITPSSPFPSGETYATYKAYYKEKYKLDVQHQDQPLIEVKQIGSQGSFHVNLLVHQTGPHNKESRRMLHRDKFQEHLVPELCCVHPMPASFLVQALHIPSILHRYRQLLLAGDMYSSLGFEHNRGKPDWKALSYGPITTAGNCDNADGTRTSVVSSGGDQEQTLEDGEIVSDDDDAVHVTDYHGQAFDMFKVIVDPEDCIFTVTLSDVELFHNSVTFKPVSASRNDECNADHYIPPEKKRNMLDNMRHTQIRSIHCHDIELSSLLKALTLAACNDGFDLERLEMVGDSFLKFAVSVHLFCAYKSDDEGKLSTRRMRLINNKILYKLGKMKGLPGYINSHPFEPRNFCAPPGFKPPVALEDILIELGLNYTTLQEYTAEELFEFDPKQLRYLVDCVVENITGETPKEVDTCKVNGFTSYFHHHSVSDKSVADCVEAMIGAHLLGCGDDAAIHFLSWLGMRDRGLEGDEISLHHPLPTAVVNYHNMGIDMDDEIESYIFGVDRLEKRIGYKFKDVSLLLQAFTHASFFQNRITDCYQRLEFLGDAVLDYLITRHIYEDGPNLTPGQMTDLRSALVNNITFASIAVREGLHKYLRHSSPQLQTVIDRFVLHQEENGHKVSGHFELLGEDEDIAGEIEVPKVLGDLFESLAGAIYLDSGMSLNKVWGVFKSLMNREITEFTRNVPMSPLRELHERYPHRLDIRPVAHDEFEKEGFDVVRICVKIGGKDQMFHGLGRGKQRATAAAAKLALRNLKK